MAQAEWQALACAAVRWRGAKQPARAVECLTRAIELTQELPELTRRTGTLLNYLADLYLQEGQLTDAELAIRRALGIRLGLPAPAQDLAADDLSILPEVLSKQG